LFLTTDGEIGEKKGNSQPPLTHMHYEKEVEQSGLGRRPKAMRLKEEVEVRTIDE
jgi:hypothetical protein